MEGKPESENLPSADQVQRGQGIIEFVSAGLGVASGGLSEAVMLPIRRVLAKRVQRMEEAIVADLRNGRISEDDVIEEERLASFVLRVQRAAFEGVGQKKLRLMARIFFKEATSEDFAEDKMHDFWGITEQLNVEDMKVLVLLKRAFEAGHFNHDMPGEEARPKIAYELDTESEFASQPKFNEAVGALLRFGLVDAVSGWGSLVYFPTERCLDYVRHLDFAYLDGSSHSQR